MVHLNECMKQIRKLVKEKGHENTSTDDTILKKGLFAIIEMSEAMDIVKKKGIQNLSKSELESLCEELIDVIFYVLDIYGLLVRDYNAIDPDYMFIHKLKKNFYRRKRYGRPMVNTKPHSKYYDVPITC